MALMLPRYAVRDTLTRKPPCYRRLPMTALRRVNDRVATRMPRFEAH
jgi:hypothetical protein